MYVSYETPEEIEQRSRSVIAAATLVWLDGAYAFEEYSAERFPHDEVGDALACVRDHDVWSVLKPAGPDARELFGLLRFHFAEGLDNSGFVGWLASRLKQDLGTGVFVVCGQNSRSGGIFDYVGVPIAKKDEAAKAIARLRGE